MNENDPPGFVRLEGKTGRVFYLPSPDPSQPGQKLRKLYNSAQVEEYLEAGNIADVKVQDFDFKKRKLPESEESLEAEKKRQRPASDVFAAEAEEVLDKVDGDVLPADAAEADPPTSRFDFRKLMTGGLKVNHLEDLHSAARLLDQQRTRQVEFQAELDLAEVKLNLSTAESIDELVRRLGTSEVALRLMANVVEDRVFEVLLTLSSSEGRNLLSEFPNSQQENFFAEVVKLASRKTPVALSFLTKLIVKDNASAVAPSHVISIATVFSHLAHFVDRGNNALLKMNSLQMKLDGVTAQS